MNYVNNGDPACP